MRIQANEKCEGFWICVCCASIIFHIYTNETFLLLTIFSILTPEKYEI